MTELPGAAQIMNPKWWFGILAVAVISLAVVLASGFGIEQKRQQAGLQITAVNATAAAYLNGTYLNQTPLIEKNLHPGTYTVRLVADDTSLVPYEQQVTLHPGTLATLAWKPAVKAEQASSVMYQLEPLGSTSRFWQQWWHKQTDQMTGEFKIITLPDNAIVNLPSRSERQFAPFVFTNVPAGKLDYSVYLPSYETHQHTVEIKPGYRTIAFVALAKNPPVSEGHSRTKAATEEQVLGSQTGNEDSSLKTVHSASLSAQPGQAAVLIKATSFRENGDEVLRVRLQPHQEAPTIGLVKVGIKLPYAGEMVDGWYKVQYATQSGWVSQVYSQLENAATASGASSAHDRRTPSNNPLPTLLPTALSTQLPAPSLAPPATPPPSLPSTPPGPLATPLTAR